MSIPYAEVIGDPVAHSKSPLIHKFWLAKLGIEGDYRACHVRSNELADYFARRRGDAEWRGCNVTIPHKIAVRPFLDRAEQHADSLGAVNTVVSRQSRFVGHNSDIAGIAESLKHLKSGALACVIGTGGAARAALHYLNRNTSVSAVRILARSIEARDALRNEFCSVVGTFGFDDVPGALSSTDAVINASSLGMTNAGRMPEDVIDWLAHTNPGALVFDMVYAPLETELLVGARSAGLRSVDGLTMLVGQAGAAFELFFGQPAPREHDAELRALLTA